MTILVTGAGGFIGYHLCQSLLQAGKTVIGIDNLSVVADQPLQKLRVENLKNYTYFQFYNADICDLETVRAIMVSSGIHTVIHLAAKTGIKPSQQYPDLYLQTNIIGFHHLIQLSYNLGIAKFIFASSSSVYGTHAQLPFREDQPLSPPLNIYAVTKQTNEAIAHTYALRGKMQIIALRLFTVYGSYYRSDMALSKFAHALINQQTVYISERGSVQRDFTHIGDVCTAIRQLLTYETSNNFTIFNLGYGQPIALTAVVNLMGKYLGIKPQIQFQPLDPIEIPVTHADITKLQHAIQFRPQIAITTGIADFLDWYLSRH